MASLPSFQKWTEDFRSRPPPHCARTARDQRRCSPPPRRQNEEDNRRQYSQPRRENDDNRRQRSGHDVSSHKTVPPLSEQGGGRSRMVLGGERGGFIGGGNGEKRDSDDKCFYAQFRKQLSEFNEGLPHRDSPSMKFQWKHLLDERSNSGGIAANPSLNNHLTSSYGGGADSIRMSTEREFEGTRYPDLGRHDTFVTKPMSVEIERGGVGNRMSSFYHPDVGMGIGKDCSVQLNGKLQSPMTNSHVGVHHNNEEFTIRDTLREVESRRELLYKNYENPMLLNDKSHYTMPSHSQAHDYPSIPLGTTKNNFPGFYSDHLHTSSDGISMSRGMVGEPVPRDGYAHHTLNSSVNPELQVKDVMNHRYVQHSLTDANSRDYAYPEVQRTERRDLGVLTDDFFGKMTTVREGYGHQDRLRASIVDPIVDRVNDNQSFHGDHLRRSRVYEDHPSLQEQPGVFADPRSLQEQPSVFENHRSLQEQPGVFEEHHSLQEHRSLQERPVPVDYSDLIGEQPVHDYPSLNHGGDMWDSRTNDLQFETEQYRGHEILDETENYRDHEGLHESQIYGDHESSQMAEDYGIGSTDIPWSYDENLSRLPMSDCAAGQYGIGDGTHGRLTAEEPGLADPSEYMLKRKRGVDKNMSRRKPRGHLLSHTNIYGDIYDLTNGNKQLRSENIDNLHLPNKLRHSQNRKALRSSSEMASHKNSSGDWLSSRNMPTTLRMRLSKPEISAARDIKKRLGPGPQNNLNTSSVIKFEKRRQDGFHGSLDAQADNLSEAKVVSAKIKPPEDSEDFKQLVNIAFLKFVKQLYENPAQRRRYMEHGKGGKLKCSICDSNYFVDTNSLAMHAFKCLKVEVRSQHLGFHKALCVLMSWNSAVVPNSSRVVLPKAEALALKEDLVIWPPVVIIHNSSIGNNGPDKRMIVTIEVLETILRDMGFGAERINVCRGKPANQSIMVVRFKGTFSGLQEAEKLHKLYAESTHGRSEFQQISSDSGDKSSEVQNRLADKAEHVLYGYLGIVEDLDKLDFETKKRSLVKSKKEIQAIADASS